MNITVMEILLCTLNVSVLISGYFLKRFVSQTDKRLHDLEHYGCALCQMQLKGQVHKKG